MPDSRALKFRDHLPFKHGMLSAGTQDAHTHSQPRASQEGRGLVVRRRLGWVVIAFWIAYSAAVLGWHALTAPPADACIVR